MKVKKSREYTQDDGSKVSFTFDRADGKIVGIKKDGVSVSPNTSEFADFSQSDDAVAAYNVAKYTSNKRSYVDSVASKTSAELNSYYINESKKEENEQFLEQEINAIENVTPKENASVKGKTESMACPLDLNFKQDHFKISKYNYVRPSVSQSRSPATFCSEYLDFFLYLPPYPGPVSPTNVCLCDLLWFTLGLT